MSKYILDLRPAEVQVKELAKKVMSAFFYTSLLATAIYFIGIAIAYSLASL